MLPMLRLLTLAAALLLIGCDSNGTTTTPPPMGSGSTTIRYEIGTAGPVSLKVYDALGREVAVLVDGTLAPSAYEATFDASGLASGIYVYRLVAGNEVLTGSMTLVK